MKVILTEKVPTLGNIGEIVNVKPGHARNFLIPNKKAIIADQENQSQRQHLERMLAKKMAEEKSVAESVKTKLDGLTLELIKKVGASGKLFGTVTTNDLTKELAKKDIEVSRRILTVDRPIKAVGSYNIKAKLFKDVEANFTVKVEIDPIQAEELKKKAQLATKKKKAEAKKPSEGNEEEAKEQSQELSEEEKLAKEAAEILKS